MSTPTWEKSSHQKLRVIHLGGHIRHHTQLLVGSTDLVACKGPCISCSCELIFGGSTSIFCLTQGYFYLAADCWIVALGADLEIDICHHLVNSEFWMWELYIDICLH